MEHLDAAALDTGPEHLDAAALDTGLERIRKAPAGRGTVDMVVRRPGVDQREVLEVGTLDPEVGLVGDNWSQRPSSRTADNSPHPDMQLNVMSSRVVDLVSGGRDRWHLAGDQLFLDLDLSHENLPAGTRLALGTAVIEVTDQPHTGCRKFVRRFGAEAMRWVNSPEGRALRLRGLCARVVEAGQVRPGDEVVKLPTGSNAGD